MAAIGIDLGTDGLRAGRMADAQFNTLRSGNMPRLITDLSDGAWYFTSLKRLLDFDSTIDASVGGGGSIDYCSKLLSEIGAECKDAACGEIDTLLAVPSSFSQRQRSALRTVVAKAGFRRMRLANDALAVVYASRNELDGCRNTLVYSWGAGAFSVALYEPAGSSFRLLGQDGDRCLGGDDLNGEILRAVWQSPSLCDGSPLRSDDLQVRLQALDLVEEIKRLLAAGKPIDDPAAKLAGRDNAEGLVARISGCFRDRLLSMIETTLRLTDGAVEASGGAEPDVVLIAGGMTLIPQVKEAIESRYGGRIRIRVAASDAVVKGCAEMASSMLDEEWEELEAEPQETPASQVAVAQANVGEQHEREAVSPIPDDRPAKPGSGRWADNFIPILDAAQRLHGEGDFNGMLAEFDRLQSETNKFRSQFYHTQGVLLAQSGQLEEAFRRLETASRLSPSSGAYLDSLLGVTERLAKKLQRDRNRVRTLLDVADAGIEAIRRSSDGTARHRLFLSGLLAVKGNCHYQLRQYAEGRDALSESIRLDPRRDDVQKLLAQVNSIAQGPRPSPGQPAIPKVGPNKPCPCGSGNKYKKCHGKRA